jgi:hypothetical protein
VSVLLRRASLHFLAFDSVLALFLTSPLNPVPLFVCESDSFSLFEFDSASGRHWFDFFLLDPACTEVDLAPSSVFELVSVVDV